MPICIQFQPVFYVTGSIGLGFAILWFFLVTDEPRDHKCIRKSELEYIETYRPKVVPASGLPPYCKILLSPAVWTVMFCDFANSWGLFTLLNDGPTFINKVLHQDITEVISALCSRNFQNVKLSPDFVEI